MTCDNSGPLTEGTWVSPKRVQEALGPVHVCVPGGGWKPCRLCLCSACDVFLTDLKPVFCPCFSPLVSCLERLCCGPPSRTPCRGEHTHVSGHMVAHGQGTHNCLTPIPCAGPAGCAAGVGCDCGKTWGGVAGGTEGRLRVHKGVQRHRLPVKPKGKPRKGNVSCPRRSSRGASLF